MALPPYAMMFRGFPACPCQFTWLPAFEQHLRAKGIITGTLPVSQLIGGFEASGGTHSTGGASDIVWVGDTAIAAVREARQMGADATWYRPAGWDNGGGIGHVHSVLRGCPHLSQDAKDQYSAVDSGGDGLGGTTTPDPGPRPLSGRTWREGIEWAKQQEDDMADPKVLEQLDRIEEFAKDAAAEIKGLKQAETARAQAARKRDEGVLVALDKLAASVTTRAGKDQVRKIKELLTEPDPEETP